jgi:hypothetical protein
MAEAIAAIGAIASITQLAEYGFKLSIKLFAFGEAVATADRSVKSLSNEISLTSTVRTLLISNAYMSSILEAVEVVPIFRKDFRGFFDPVLICS